MVQQPHLLLVTFPTQGHINPALQFAKRLLRLGVHVTFATAVSGRRRMAKSLNLDGLSFATFSDGFDDGFNHGVDDGAHYMSEIKCNGFRTLSDVITRNINEGRPITYMVYTILLTWAAEAAREFHIPAAILWTQPAAVFDIFYYYFNGYGDIIGAQNNEPSSCLIQLPGLPLLASREIPSILVPSDSTNYLLPTSEEQFEILKKESNPKILVNTFDALEPEALKAIEKLNLIGIGPLIPSAFLDGKDPSDTSFGGDLFKSSKDYSEWLNSKHESSVVYISFGSILVLSKQQMEEIAKGLLESGFPFLWVIKAKQEGEEEKEEERLSCREELERQGMIVPWCSQIEVLTHPSIGCFLTHCGWNSSLESLVSGIPVVAFPKWADQGTNAKLIEDVWKTGVRVKLNEKGIVGGDEIKRCLDLVMGKGNIDRGAEMREKAKKWKGLAQEAMKDGGTSYNNLKAFVDEVVDGSLHGFENQTGPAGPTG